MKEQTIGFLPEERFVLHRGYSALTALKSPRHITVPYSPTSFEGVDNYITAQLDDRKRGLCVLIAEPAMGKSVVLEHLRNYYSGQTDKVIGLEFGAVQNYAKRIGKVKKKRMKGFLTPQEYDEVTDIMSNKIDYYMHVNPQRKILVLVAIPGLLAITAESSLLGRLSLDDKPFPEAVVTEQYIGLNKGFTALREARKKYEPLFLGLGPNENRSRLTMKFRALMVQAVREKNKELALSLFKTTRQDLDGIDPLKLGYKITKESAPTEGIEINRRQLNQLIFWLDYQGLSPLPRTGLKIESPGDLEIHSRYRERACWNHLVYMMSRQYWVPYYQGAILASRSVRSLERYLR